MRAEDACTASSQTPLPECPLTQQSLRSERHAGAVDGAVTLGPGLPPPQKPFFKMQLCLPTVRKM